MLKRDVYGFIIYSKLHDKLIESKDLYLTIDKAIEEAKAFNKLHFKGMIGNHFDHRKFVVYITK